MRTSTFTVLLSLLANIVVFSQQNINQYNISWHSPSSNSSESMPCGGGDIGLNVWVENGDVLFYIARSGTFDEHNTMLKLGRVRLQCNPNPFMGNRFSQTLKLEKGHIEIEGENNGLKARIVIWVDVFNPIIHVDVESNKAISVQAHYENWRFEDRPFRKFESFSNSYKWAPPVDLKMFKDDVDFYGNAVLFFHRNRDHTVFDVTVAQQGLESVKNELFNPLQDLIFGGIMYGEGWVKSDTSSGKYLDTDFKSWSLKTTSPTKRSSLNVVLHTEQHPTVDNWKEELANVRINADKKTKHQKTETEAWWKNLWERSYINVNPNSASVTDSAWQIGRNYQLFRYMLACNAFGSYPTKFNGGLFTYDPCFINPDRCFTPDFRNWGGGTFTAQNQRLVYFPMLRSGDFEMMDPQIDFYLCLQKNAELRSRIYWNHNGACFTEQLENFGLPNPSEYGWKRPEWYDKGMQYNAWLEYQWDSSLEFCLMMLELQAYTGKNIEKYIPFIESCLTFFDEHYQYLARRRGRKALDADGHLILYPGSACETYKMAYNANSTIAGLTTVLERLLELPEQYHDSTSKAHWQEMLQRIPPLTYREVQGKTTIAPARLWERINNTETPQLYPVYPWGIFGIGRPFLDTAINTYLYDTDALKFRDYISWKQDNIFAARLGLTDEAAKWTYLKLRDSDRRFPAFWGPGFDWVPDHNWGGSGMIGLQEMLMQTHGNEIYLFPAWPEEWDVRFKLHAPGNTVVEAECINGVKRIIRVEPEFRKGDFVF